MPVNLQTTSTQDNGGPVDTTIKLARGLQQWVRKSVTAGQVPETVPEGLKDFDKAKLLEELSPVYTGIIGEDTDRTNAIFKLQDFEYALKCADSVYTFKRRRDILSLCNINSNVKQ